LNPSFGGPGDGPGLRPLAPSFDVLSGGAPQRGAPPGTPGGPSQALGTNPAHAVPGAAPLPGALPAGAAPSAPLSPSVEAALRSLSLEQYACFEAELLAHPSREAAVLQRYELDVAGVQALRHRFQTQFAGDPTLHARFSRLLEHYRSSFGSR